MGRYLQYAAVFMVGVIFGIVWQPAAAVAIIVMMIVAAFDSDHPLWWVTGAAVASLAACVAWVGTPVWLATSFFVAYLVFGSAITWHYRDRTPIARSFEDEPTGSYRLDEGTFVHTGEHEGVPVFTFVPDVRQEVSVAVR